MKLQKKCYIDASRMKPASLINHLKSFFSWEKAIVLLLILLGALLRVRQYLTGRSLWADEAMLALNILNRNFAGMFRPLDYDQGAPIGFLLIEKLFNSILGKNELALRLFPLIIGLISLWLFYLLLKRITSGAGLLTALALFAFNPRLVYYSSEVKQYIVDVVVTILLLLFAAPVFNSAPRKKDFARLTLAGLIALWFSHPALFVLAGIGLGLVIITLKERNYASLGLVIGMGTLWIVEIAFLYSLILKDISQNAYMREYWQGAFLPMPLWSDPGWFNMAINQNIGVQFGIPYAVYFVLLLMLVGWIVLFYQNQNYAIVFACILLITLTASALQFYPVFERMILFLIPIGSILIGSAVQAFYQRSQKYQFLSALSTSVLIGFLIYGPLVTSFQNFVQPKYFEHIRPTMEYLRDTWKDGDALFVSNGALPAFRFYAPFYGLENIPYEFGERQDYQNPQNILSQLNLLQGKPRAWILLSHVYEKGEFNEKDFILNSLDQIGEKKREFRMPGTSVFLYLYDLGNKDHSSHSRPVPSS
jgi:Dolichyl-phosphate-mannose-protein mannosyltransferase